MDATIDPNDILAAIKQAYEEDEKHSRPSPSLVVYCDQHIATAMHLATSWVSMEYGQASVDCNRLDFWRCLKPGCDRCYDPYLHGYFWYRAAMGSRIQRNPVHQKRCGKHPEIPVMCISKVGQGRAYICPLYGCTEHGETIAEFVVDEPVTVLDSDQALSGLSKDDRKKAEELALFNSFTPAAGLMVDPGSARNADPPRPDISCTINGTLHWYELGEIIGNDVAEKTSPNRRKIDGGFSFLQEQPLIDIITKKAAKTYQTDGFPVELVLYFDLRLGSKGIVQSLIQKNRGLLESLDVQGKTFSRVWVYDAFTSSVVWDRARSNG